MARETITIARTDGCKIRTSVGKRFYVTIPIGMGADGKPKAKVITRTDLVSTAYRAACAWMAPEVWDAERGRFITMQELAQAHHHKLTLARRARERARARSI